MSGYVMTGKSRLIKEKPAHSVTEKNQGKHVYKTYDRLVIVLVMFLLVVY